MLSSEMTALWPPWRWAVSLALGLAAAGCSTSHYRESADREAYRSIQQKSGAVTNMEPRFTIEQTNRFSLEGLAVSEQVEGYLGPAGESERGAAIVSLEKALEIAVQNSRVYQSSKEQLYLTALSLTLARHQFAPLFSAGGTGGLDGQTAQVTEFIPDPLDPSTPKPVLSDNLVEQNSVNARGTVRTDWLIRDVGRVSAAFVTDFSRFLTGDPRTFTSSRLAATFSRPLLRNAGFKQEQEQLEQAERDLLYGLRTFTRFRKDFTVQIASEYYGVLGARDAVRNGYQNFQSSRKMGERTRALAEESRTTQADLGRLEQQALTAESDWINAIRTYQQALDNFKIRLGIPVETRLVLDDRDLAQLTIQHPGIVLDDAIKVALTARLDYQNSRDQLEDADRRVALAADSLKTQADFVAAVSFDSDSRQTQGIALPELERYRWNAGLDLDLPLNRKAERNAYRGALITQGQAARAVVQLGDEIELEVRDNGRLLEQAKRTYEISELGVELAKRRVEEQELLAELGRAEALNQVDAQNSLAGQLNQRTQALVGHTIARLRFWNSLGILYIKENGQWQEQTDAISPQ